MIYPYEHASLAKQMVQQGGLLSEFTSGTKPDKHNFPSRNRIVAGLSDATIVIESGTKGGSIITAEIAGSYNRDVFALPGRITDIKSSGCNALIRTNKAALLADPKELIDSLGWGEWKKQERSKQKELFVLLTEEEKLITNLLGNRDFLHIEEINRLITLSAATAAATLFNLEMKGQIQSLPGKRFRILS